MSEQTRREFIKSGAALAAVLGMLAIGRELIAQPYPQERRVLGPDLVLLSGRI